MLHLRTCELKKIKILQTDESDTSLRKTDKANQRLLWAKEIVVKKSLQQLINQQDFHWFLNGKLFKMKSKNKKSLSIIINSNCLNRIKIFW